MMFSLHLLIMTSLVCVSTREVSASIKCKEKTSVQIQHGVGRVVSGGRSVKFRCHQGFVILGVESVVCRNGLVVGRIPQCTIAGKYGMEKRKYKKRHKGVHDFENSRHRHRKGKSQRVKANVNNEDLKTIFQSKKDIRLRRLIKNKKMERMMGDEPPGLGLPYGNDVVGYEDELILLDGEGDLDSNKYDVHYDDISDMYDEEGDYDDDTPNYPESEYGDNYDYDLYYESEGDNMEGDSEYELEYDYDQDDLENDYAQDNESNDISNIETTTPTILAMTITTITTITTTTTTITTSKTTTTTTTAPTTTTTTTPAAPTTTTTTTITTTTITSITTTSAMTTTSILLSSTTSITEVNQVYEDEEYEDWNDDGNDDYWKESEERHEEALKIITENMKIEAITASSPTEVITNPSEISEHVYEHENDLDIPDSNIDTPEAVHNEYDDENNYSYDNGSSKPSLLSEEENTKSELDTEIDTFTPINDLDTSGNSNYEDEYNNVYEYDDDKEYEDEYDEEYKDEYDEEYDNEYNYQFNGDNEDNELLVHSAEEKTESYPETELIINLDAAFTKEDTPDVDKDILETDLDITDNDTNNPDFQQDKLNAELAALLKEFGPSIDDDTDTHNEQENLQNSIATDDEDLTEGSGDDIVTEESPTTSPNLVIQHTSQSPFSLSTIINTTQFVVPLVTTTATITESPIPPTPPPIFIEEGSEKQPHDIKIISDDEDNFSITSGDGPWNKEHSSTETPIFNEVTTEINAEGSKFRQDFFEKHIVDIFSLDSTCMENFVEAPRIRDAAISGYDAHQKNEAFPQLQYAEVVYKCHEAFALKDEKIYSLFCSKGKWKGKMPECISARKKIDIEGESCESENDCQQLCHLESGEPRCFCQDGFHLLDDAKACEDINECLDDNGGCSQNCINKPGIFICDCEPGSSIIGGSGKECLDINECLLNNGHGPCQDTCTNTDGGYVCSCENLKGTAIGPDNHTCQAIGGCAINNGGCSHKCIDSYNQVFCMCPSGFVLGPDWKTCDDVDECLINNHGCPHLCINVPGSVHCACMPGYQGTENGLDCEDIDECVTGFGCSHDCINNVGSAICNCPSGYDLEEAGKMCQDIDECAKENGFCDQVCINKQGGWECGCEAGYHLDSNKQTCSDVNECSKIKGICGHGDCINESGFHICNCHNGFTLQSGICEDLDECAEDEDPCGDHGNCLNAVGSFECSCDSGFSFSGTTCLDLNECSIGNPCINGQCVNQEGGYSCNCKTGFYEMEGVCLDINECSSGFQCGPGQCINTAGGYQCSCPAGYEAKEGTCNDIDECLSLPCGRHGDCTNLPGSYNCQCHPGYHQENEQNPCQDIDECLDHPCTRGICFNLPGSFECECPLGFILHKENNTCLDVDECLDSNGGCHHLCVNIPGSRMCRCNNGFLVHLEDETQCKDEDECVEDNGGCDQICVNVEGGHECRCNQGFITMGKTQCVDTNECVVNNGGCNQICINFPGKRDCECHKGFSVDPSNSTNCLDINECNKDKGGCSQICVNLPGKRACECYNGFSVDPSNNTNCLDINECNKDNGGCSQTCVNLPGKRDCKCHNGFSVDHSNNTHCLDVNECNKENGGCSQICVNLPGKRACECYNGFSVDPINNTNCLDINECNKDNGGCSQSCQNINGGRKCLCDKGYLLTPDNRTCGDLNECTVKNGDCSHICQNLPGSHRCSCPESWFLKLDGRQCKQIFNKSKMCPRLVSPRNAYYRCTKKRSRKGYPIGTKCKMKCKKGFTPSNSAKKKCTTDSTWSGDDGTCKKETCPALNPLKNGNLVPHSCSTGPSDINTKCSFECEPGLKMSGATFAKCGKQEEWKYSRGGPPVCQTPYPPPFIMCPPDQTKPLLPRSSSTYVMFPQPKTNVDWFRFVESDPKWAKQLEGEMVLGKHVITFTAKIPMSNQTASCQMVVHVKDTDPPRVTRCPHSFVQYLVPGQKHKRVTWREPVFLDNVAIKHVMASFLPGHYFPKGRHHVLYQATDADGNRARCGFTISVKRSPGHRFSERPHRHPTPVPSYPEYARTRSPPRSSPSQRQTTPAPSYQEQLRTRPPPPSFPPRRQTTSAPSYPEYPVSITTRPPRPLSSKRRTRTRRLRPSPPSSPPRRMYNPSQLPSPIAQPPSPGISKKSLPAECDNVPKVPNGKMACLEKPHRKKCTPVCDKGHIFYQKFSSRPPTYLCSSRRIDWKISKFIPDCTPVTKTTTGTCSTGWELRDNYCVACPPGMFRDVAAPLCQLCPKSSYTDKPGSGQCSMCPVSQTTRRLGSRHRNKCHDGNKKTAGRNGRNSKVGFMYYNRWINTEPHRNKG